MFMDEKVMGRIKKTNPLIFVMFISVMVAGCVSKSVPVLQQNKPGNQMCLKEFTVLKTLDVTSYDLYSKQFSDINREYATFKSQGDNLNKDAKEILGLELDSKLQLVCARVKNSAFHSMQKRSVDLNKI